MAVYYVASKLSIVACSTTCIAIRRRNKCVNNKEKSSSDEDKTIPTDTSWRNKEVSLYPKKKLLLCVEQKFQYFRYIIMHEKGQLLGLGNCVVWKICLVSNVNTCYLMILNLDFFFGCDEI